MTHRLYAALTALFLLSTLARSEELAPFTSDGCSSFPDGTPNNQNLWLTCCIKHDLAYWQGGTYQQRLDADVALEQCVAQAGEPDIAKLMLQGVRAGGSPLFLTPYRWGYGWPFGRGYRALTNEERKQVDDMLKSAQAMLDEARERLRAEK